MSVTNDLIREVREAFVEYERAFTSLIAKRPGDRMSAEYTEEIIASKDEEAIRAHLADLRRATDDLNTSTIV